MKTAATLALVAIIGWVLVGRVAWSLVALYVG